jgi:hypothetical protein
MTMEKRVLGRSGVPVLLISFIAWAEVLLSSTQVIQIEVLIYRLHMEAGLTIDTYESSLA